MSKILALDTSTDACSVAIACDGQIVEQFALVPREHTRRLLPMVDEILSDHGFRLQDMDAIAFGRGPGSFTGLRICLGVVQGLAFGADLPVVPVSTLQAMAVGAYRTLSVSRESALLVALDARMKEVYWGLFGYRVGAEGGQQLVALENESVMSPEKVVDTLARQTLSSVVGVGPGWHYDPFKQISASAVYQDCYPHAYDIADLAQSMLTQGEAVSALEVSPVYLRDTVSWKKRQRIRPLNT